MVADGFAQPSKFTGIEFSINPGHTEDAQAVRAYGAIENLLHWTLDVAFIALNQNTSVGRVIV